MKPLQYICDLNPYQPGAPIELVARQYGLDPATIIKLASNENPLGISPKAEAAARRALKDGHMYPDQYRLTQKLAAMLKVTPENIVLGSGSNDILDLVARVFLGKGREAISSRYAFAVYQIATQSVGARNVVVDDKAFAHDLDAMLEAITPRTSVVWIANPNNPTGTLASYQDVKRFLGKVPKDVIVVLDEAYNEYLEPRERADSVSWLKVHPNLVITRTFSKMYGLAGLRIGYGLARTEIVELFNRVRLPFNVNSLALVAAEAALDDHEFIERSAQVNRLGRQQLLDGLVALGLECLPAHGNFVTFRVSGAGAVNQHLLESGIIVRPLTGYGMPDWLRVTVGLPSQNDRFLRTLAGIVD